MGPVPPVSLRPKGSGLPGRTATLQEGSRRSQVTGTDGEPSDAQELSQQERREVAEGAEGRRKAGGSRCSPDPKTSGIQTVTEDSRAFPPDSQRETEAQRCPRKTSVWELIHCF